jgi:uncharacterized NAD-dependent epimerase/dehydratase family protein
MTRLKNEGMAMPQDLGADVNGTRTGVLFEQPCLLFLGDVTDPDDAKTAFGLRDWAGAHCVGQYRFSGAAVDLGLQDMTPTEAHIAGARSLIVGVAPMGGKIASSWIDPFTAALEAGLDIVSGMHSKLGNITILNESAKRLGRRLIDLRHNDRDWPVGTGLKRGGKRLLTVGTDCALGKKYTAMALAQAFAARGLPATFRATGQTGIMISGGGCAIDAVIADFIAGAAETISPDAVANHWDIIEGQGTILHPAYAGVSLGLLHGSQPDAFVVCHDPVRAHLSGMPHMPVPSVEQIAALTVELGRVTNPAIRCVGVSLNLSRVPIEQRARLLTEYAERLSVPAFDPMLGGIDAVVDHLLATDA